ncbi:MAG: NADH-quinone oxidoreductase subunit L, partial [Pirellulaceae bacterium]
MDPTPSFWLPILLGGAVLVPLLSFFIILIAGAKWMGSAGENAAPVSVAAIALSAVLSFLALGIWLTHHWPSDDVVGVHHGGGHGEAGHGEAGHGEAGHGAGGHGPADPAADQHGAGQHGAGHGSAQQSTEPDAAAARIVRGQDPAQAADTPQAAPADSAGDHAAAGAAFGQPEPAYYAGEFQLPGLGPWVLGEFGRLRISISYYIDALTVCMFCMVTFIATLIHIYAMGYMHDELHDITDHEVTTSSGEPLHRPGRYHRFFQYLSLFCFSMLGLVVAGNIAMVFMFWELVGVCSYFLIGFYVERKSASTAANKAFIVNRVGDFGMIIGLMALWSALGTFSFGDIRHPNGDIAQPGLFGLVRSQANQRQLAVPAGMQSFDSQAEIGRVIAELGADAPRNEVDAAVAARLAELHASTAAGASGTGYWLLVVAGIGIFAGCVGKSAQFPLHVWLPDAMEGPTPVSALVHSATMVAAGVYLVGRFYPVFTPEVLLVIAVVGCITLFLAATIAITATDIKRVLAYSTVSQLGYMMLALGVGGWLAGLLHLITHAFFKSLLFMCSGSVIHAVHTNDMREMGGLRHKMPVTAYTMLVGCLAIAGAGIPFMMGWIGGASLTGLGFSGFYSKDAILEQAFSYWQSNPSAWSGIFFLAAGGGAAITAFYMFRMWYMTFAGAPRNRHRFDHAHESPPTMYMPLVILSVMAVAVAWTPYQALVGGLVAVIAFAVIRTRAGGDTAVPAHPVTAGHDGHGHDGHGHASHDHGSPAQQHETPGHGSTVGHGHDAHGYDAHGHDSHGHAGGGIAVGNLPLLASGVVLAVAALGLVAYLVGGVPFFTDLTLARLLESARPAGTAATVHAVWLPDWVWPNEHDSHSPAIVVPVTLIAIGTAFSGFLLATVMYGLGRLNPAEVQRQFAPVYRLLINKWWFDELYDWLFVRPTLGLSRIISGFDRNWIDWLIDGIAAVTKWFSQAWEMAADRIVVDGLINRLA